MIRVLQFADLINRHDFIDVIVQHADPRRFQVGVCVRTPHSNIAAPVYSERTPRWVLGDLSRWSIPRVGWQLARLLRSWRANILHTHHYDQAVIGWFATRIYPKTRLVIGRHYSDSIYRESQGAKRAALLIIERIVNHAASRIVVPSHDVATILTERQRVHPDKVDKVVYPFVPEKVTMHPGDVQRLRQELGMERQFVVGTFARLHDQKGQQFLVEAIGQLRERLPHLRLILVGEGPNRGALEHQVETLHLRDRVRFLGWRRDALTLMGAVDAVVQPTLQEAFSQVMGEAMWLRKPLVITDVSGASDIITNGRNGLLVPKADVAVLARAIETLAADESLRLQLGEAGRAYVEGHLMLHQIIPQYERVYERAVES